MLNTFRIANLFLIEELEIEVNGGFVAITGESGAGKSMIVRALTLLSGKKASGIELREGTDKGFIEAYFKPTKLVQAKLELLCEESSQEWIFRREFRSEGRSRAFINDSPVSNAVLGSACDLLLRFSLQEDVGALRNPERQLAFVDTYAQHGQLLAGVVHAYREWKQASDKLNQLTDRSKTERNDWDWAKEELRELVALGYESGQRDALKAEREQLRNLSTVIESYESLHEALEGDHGSARLALNTALASARAAARWDEQLAQSVTKIEEQLIILRELARDIEHSQTRLQGNPNRLEQIEQRLQAIADVERKWRIGAEEIPAKLDQLQKTTAQYESLDQAISATEIALAKALDQFQHSAALLTKSRKNAAEKLFAETASVLPSLGITKPQLVPQWLARSQPSEDGIDELHILFSANQDVPPRELGLVISGGELARLELALLSVGNGGENLTLIMDEVDRGVSGRIASAVGKCLRSIGQHCPVVMVTHLPQVAAAAHQHIGIEKQTIAGRTQIVATTLSHTDRVQTLASMLGGAETGKGAVAGARELLTEAQN